MRLFLQMRSLAFAVHLAMFQVFLPPIVINFLSYFLKVVQFDPLMEILDSLNIKLVDDDKSTFKISRLPR